MYACKHLMCVTMCVCLRFRYNLEFVPRSDRKVDSGTTDNSNTAHLVVSCVFESPLLKDSWIDILERFKMKITKWKYVGLCFETTPVKG